MNLFMDSFDHYNTVQIGQKYQTVRSNAGFPQISATAARTGAQGIAFAVAGSVGRTVPKYGRYIGGYAGNWNGVSLAGGAIPIMNFFDPLGNVVQTGARMFADGSIQIYRGNVATVLGISAAGAFNLVQGVFRYVDMKVDVTTAASGSATVRVDGVPVLSVSGVVTAVNANQVTSVVIGDALNQMASGVAWRVDDYYINDDTGTQNNDFEPDVGIYMAGMVSQGSFLQWGVAGAASNLAAIQSNPAVDTKYVFDSTPNDRDTYLPDVFPTANIPLSVQLVTRAEKDSASAKSYQQNVRSGAVDAFSPTIALPVGYNFDCMVQEKDPATGLPWGSMNAVHNSEYGQKLIL